jgi:coenzyme F420-reducing hydrogenase gamma subunit
MNIGACATIGGVNKMKNNFDLNEVKRCVYGKDAEMPHLATTTTRAVHEVVEVDYKIHGCPINGNEFAYIIRELLLGKKPVIADYPVCVECKAKENICRYEYGEICLGPIIRAGCEAPCPTAGWRCFGCRGMVDNPNVDAAKEVMDKYKLTVDDLKQKMVLFNSK